MKKKILAFLLSAATVFCTYSGAFAQYDKIISNEREITFRDPESVIENGVLLVPARRLCSLVGASINWKEEEQRIIINSSDNVTRLFLYIGNPELRIFTFTGIAEGTGVNVPLTAPVRIINDRTLVPFEQICDALKVEYELSADKSTVTMLSNQIEKNEKRVNMSIYSDKEDVAKGDEVTVFVKAENLDIYPELGYSGVTASIIYDSTKFEVVSSSFTEPDGKKVEGALGASNDNFTEDSMKMAYVTITPMEYTDSFATVGQVVFRALDDNGGAFKLSNRISDLGYDTSLVFINKTTQEILGIESAKEMTIDTTDLIVK